MNFIPLFLLSGLLHAYIGVRLLPDLASSPAGQVALASGLLVSALAMPMGLAGSRLAKGAWGGALTWLGLLCMGLFSSLLVLTLLRDAFLLASWLAGLALPDGLPLADWRVVSAEVVPLLALAVTGIGFLNARRTAKVVRVDVPIADLPAALHGFTLAQISDVHVGPTIRQDYLQRIVTRVNGLGADVIAITGDLVDGRVSELAAHVAPLAGLQSRHGTFFVTGNHEYYSGVQAWIVELRRLGLTVLMNEHVVLRHGGRAESLVLAGVTDFGAGHFDAAHRSDPRAALAGSPAAAVRVLLAHQPRSAAAAAAAGFDLQLSGHTHGGQFWPWNLFVRFQQPFTAGLHRLQDLWVYTSRGTGYWGPPKRFGAASEITMLRLVGA
jgi:uncharacterized protein